jgi:hypothetical protein
MNWDVLKSNWKQFKDRLKALWGPWDLIPRRRLGQKLGPTRVSMSPAAD